MGLGGLIPDRRCPECGTKTRDAKGGWFVVHGVIPVSDRNYVPCSQCGEPKGLDKKAYIKRKLFKHPAEREE